MISPSLVKIGLKTKKFYHYAKFCPDPFLNCNYSSSMGFGSVVGFQKTVDVFAFLKAIKLKSSINVYSTVGSSDFLSNYFISTPLLAMFIIF